MFNQLSDEQKMLKKLALLSEIKPCTASSMLFSFPYSQQKLIDASTQKLFDLFGKLRNTDRLKFLIEEAIDRGIDIDVQDKDGFTLLHKSINERDYNIAGFLLERKANPNIHDRDIVTPLNRIAGKPLSKTEEDFHMAKLLLQKGALTEPTDFSGWTPIQYAVFNEKIGIVELLIDYGANLDIIVPKGFYKGKNLIELVRAISSIFSDQSLNKQLQTLLKFATACQNNDFGLVDYSVKKENSDTEDDSVTKEDIEKFINHKISIKPSVKLLPKYLKELIRLKGFLETKEEFIKDNTIKRLEDNINSKSSLKYLLLSKIVESPSLYKFDVGMPEDLKESLEEHGLKLVGDID